jgi:hypothetical protein
LFKERDLDQFKANVTLSCQNWASTAIIETKSDSEVSTPEKIAPSFGQLKRLLDVICKQTLNILP